MRTYTTIYTITDLYNEEVVASYSNESKAVDEAKALLREIFELENDAQEDLDVCLRGLPATTYDLSAIDDEGDEINYMRISKNTLIGDIK